MQVLKRLYAYYDAYHGHGRPLLKYIGIVAAATYLVFYLIRFTKPNPKPFDDVGLRLVVVTLFLLLALRDQWPQRLRRFYLPFSYGALIFCLPFFNVFMALQRHGGVPAISNCFIALSFLVLVADWRNTVVILASGIASAALAHFSLEPGSSWPRDLLLQIPAYLIIVVGGAAFKLSDKQIDAEKARLAAALAGSIAHEMRHPLTQLQIALQAVQKLLPWPVRGADQRVAAGDLDALHRHVRESTLAVQRGLQAITMTLDEVSAKAADPASFQQLSVADVTLQAVQEYAYAREEERARVEVEVAEDFSFRGDETAYVFLLFNLLKNALYYAPAYPDTRITITIDGHQVKVRDTGPGIAPEVLPTLFAPFRSLGKSGGTGLGLAYCRRVMGAFGGTIACASVLGEFTEFTLSFPPVSAEDEAQYRLAAIARARTVLAGRRLLVVEDDPLQRAGARQKLQPLAATTPLDEAADGATALRLLGQRKYDIVLLDLHLPDMDGHAVAGQVRREGGPNQHVHIVAHTSEPAYMARAKALQAGMDGFLGKPCAQLPLLAALQRVLQHPAGGGGASGRLAGRRILVADDSAFNRKAIAATLRNAAAFVIEVEHGAAVLEQLQAQDGIDAVIVDLHMPGMDGLETARAIRAAAEPWSGVPIVAMTARSDEPAVAAATAAGMNGFLVKPVDPLVLCDTLTRLVSGHVGMTAAAEPPRTDNVISVNQDHLLNFQRLESYRRLGMLDELLNDYLPEMRRLLDTLEEAVRGADIQGSIDALHSLLGMSGEAGAQGLYQQVRRLYVPLLEEGHWPTGKAWLPQLQELARQTEEALRAYCTTDAPSGAR